MRKSIQIGLKDVVARTFLSQATMHGKVRVSYSNGMAFYPAFSPTEEIRGRVELIHQCAHGWLVMVKPDQDSIHRLWDVMPVWISECGNSGVLNTMRPDQDLDHALRDLKVQREKEEIQAIIGAGI